jgi:biopolymer transport protein ExbD
MQFTPHKRRRAPSVIIVSLIDVLLVVLIFLMVSTTFKNAQASLKLTLPESKQAKTGPTESKPFTVSISSNSPHFYLEGHPVTMERLQKELFTASQRDPQLKLTIKADRHAPFGEYIRVIDAAQAAKVAGISVVTEKQKTP